MEEQDRPLLPPPLLVPSLRRTAAVLVLVCAVLVVVGAARYHDGTRPSGLDDLVTERLPAALTAHQRALGHVADVVPPAVTVLALLVAGLSAARRRWREAAFAVLAPGLTTVLVESLKHVVGRTTEHAGLAYPSGHTAGATSLLLVLALPALGATRRHRRSVALLLAAAVTIGAAAVGLTMVAIGAHYPTDTVAGYGTALAVTLGLALALDALGERRRRTRSRTTARRAAAPR